MWRRNKAAVILLVLCAAVLLFSFWPRSFAQALFNVPVEQLTSIEVMLDPVDNRETGYYRLTLTPEDEGFNQLLELLASRRYLPLFPGDYGRSLLMEYGVWISFSYLYEGEIYTSPNGVYLTGDRPIMIGQRNYTVSRSEAFQQAVLDLVLAQGPENVD